MRTALLLSLVVPLLLASPVAHADDTNVARAKERFTRAAQAYREARYQDAIDLFLQANQLDPHPELIFNVGQAYEKLGDVPNALRSYREYLRLSPGATDRATVETSIKNLETRLRERGVQQVSIFSQPAGAQLSLDGKNVGQTPWTGEITPGRHVAVLKATGYPDTAKEFLLTSDRAIDLDIALSNVPMGAGATTLAPKAGDAAPPPATPAEPPKKSVKPWTIAALGVGVASFGGAIISEVLRKSAENDAKNDPTQVGFKDKLDTMTTRQTAARALVAVGAIATAAGGVLLVFDLKPSASAPPKAALGCVDGACGAFVSGRF